MQCGQGNTTSVDWAKWCFYLRHRSIAKLRFLSIQLVAQPECAGRNDADPDDTIHEYTESIGKVTEPVPTLTDGLIIEIWSQWEIKAAAVGVWETGGFFKPRLWIPETVYQELRPTIPARAVYRLKGSVWPWLSFSWLRKCAVSSSAIFTTPVTSHS